MFTYNEAIAFAKLSARSAIDQAAEYDDARESLRANVIDTLCEQNARAAMSDALDAFDAEYLLVSGLAIKKTLEILAGQYPKCDLPIIAVGLGAASAVPEGDTLVVTLPSGIAFTIQR